MLHKAYDRSDRVFNVFRQKNRWTSNPGILKHDTTQELFAEGADSVGMGWLKARVEEVAKATGRTKKKRRAGEAWK